MEAGSSVEHPQFFGSARRRFRLRGERKPVQPEPAIEESIDLAKERAAFLEWMSESDRLHRRLFDRIEEKRGDQDWVTIIHTETGKRFRLEEGYMGSLETAEVAINGVTRLVKPTIQAQKTVVDGMTYLEFRGIDYSAEWDGEREARNQEGPSEIIKPEEIDSLMSVLENSTVYDAGSNDHI
ncbi:hypothetical protein EXS54_03000 [Patescibacteria group bacterium]|nr:hypothetical protein [Patescibacteria group bacterium]